MRFFITQDPQPTPTGSPNLLPINSGYIFKSQVLKMEVDNRTQKYVNLQKFSLAKKSQGVHTNFTQVLRLSFCDASKALHPNVIFPFPILP
jgi:hypothetical protein